MKEEIKAVYSCDFCKKKLFRKGAMTRHERFCTSNPMNFTKCTLCKFIVEDKKEIEIHDYDYGCPSTRKVNSFRCSKKEIGLYPLKVIRLKIIDRYPETFEGEILMPTECDDFKPNWKD